MTTHERLIALQNIVETLIAWIAHSAASPISHADAAVLLNRLAQLRDAE